MVIQLLVNSSEANCLNKNLYSSVSLTGHMREDTPVSDPIFRIEYGNPSTHNYCYISEFHRYYFIREIVSLRTSLWELHLHVDVLMSFRNYIRASMAILEESTSSGINNYLNNDVWVTTVKDKTDILSFPNGFLNSGEYILITAGGLIS